MIMTGLLNTGVEIAGGAALFGYGLLAGLLISVALSAQRWLLWYILGATGYWLSVEGIHSMLLNWLTLSDWHNYVTAIAISWLPLFGWVLYRALRYDDVSYSMQQQRQLAAARYIEHSPIYDDNYTPRFQ
jgi:hypothetical protein